MSWTTLTLSPGHYVTFVTTFSAKATAATNRIFTAQGALELTDGALSSSDTFFTLGAAGAFDAVVWAFIASQIFNIVTVVTTCTCATEAVTMDTLSYCTLRGIHICKEI